MSNAASRESTTEVLVRLSSISESLSLAQAHKPIRAMAITHSRVIPLQILFRHWGGGKTLSIKHIAFRSHIIIISFHSFHPNRFSYFSCKSNIFLRNQQINPQKFCRLRLMSYFCRGIIKEHFSMSQYINFRQMPHHIPLLYLKSDLKNLSICLLIVEIYLL